MKSLQSHYGEDKIKLVHRFGRGIGSAYKKMFEIAEGDQIVIMDADLSHHVALNLASRLAKSSF